MTEDVAHAIELLQTESLGPRGSNLYWSDRFDRALNVLLRHPEKVGEPQRLARDAMSNARIDMETREKAHPMESLDAVPENLATEQSFDHFIIELFDSLGRAHLRGTDREIINLLLTGGGAEELAALRSVPLKRARVQVSRARRRAGAVWAAA